MNGRAMVRRPDGSVVTRPMRQVIAELIDDLKASGQYLNPKPKQPPVPMTEGPRWPVL